MTAYLAYFLFGFLILQFSVAIINLLFSQNFNRFLESQDDLVSILIPARNEEKNIANILNDLLQQNYQNIEIIVFNDQSTDKTEAIVSEFVNNNNKIKYHNSSGLPENWLGKNYACHSLSEVAKGKYFLFLDADVRIYNNLITKTISYSKKYELALLSIFPKQIMQSFGEKITVPIMNFILLTLLPLILVQKSGFSSLSAANGQFMLFEAKNYKKLLPHQKMKKQRVEDIEIARFYKNQKLKIACISGKNEITCRMYQTYKEAINGFSKNVTSFFGNSFVIALIFWLITTFGFIFVLFSLPIEFFIAYFVIFIFIRIFVSIASCQNIFENILLSFIHQFVLGHIIFQSLINKKTNNLIWKERNIS